MGFFTKPKQTEPVTHHKVPKDFRAAKSTDALASQPDIAQSIGHIQSLVALPSHYFSLLYAQPLFQFLQLTQPCDRQCVAERLLTVVNGLKLRRAYILPKGVDPDSIREKKDRWTYATFIALLMYDLAQLVRPMHYHKADTHHHIATWSPLIACPPDLPYTYKAINDVAYTRTATPLLLHCLFNEACLNWLCEETQAFNEAIEAMVTPQATTSIGPLVIRSFQLDNTGLAHQTMGCRDIEKNETPINMGGSDKQTIQTAQTTDTVISPPHANPLSARALGQSFLTWLTTAIRNNSPNLAQQGLIHTLPQGIALVTPTIFQHYATTKGLNWKQIQKGFLKLRFHIPNRETGESVYALTLPNQQQINGILIPSPI